MVTPQSTSKLSRALFMMALMIAGEAIFLLPFTVARIFRPTLLEVYGISNLQLGAAMSAYGVVAVVAYFFGGPLADRFQARRLIVAALISTVLGGVIFANGTSLTGLRILFAFWGLTTILLFWAALIRATRVWGGSGSQGKAFGLLDGGRGLLGAVIASISAVIFASFLPSDAALATSEEKASALQAVIWIFAGVTLGAALLVWFFVPEEEEVQGGETQDKIQWSMIRPVLGNHLVWLQGLIVICAYVGYKGVDDLGLYSKDALDFDDVEAADLATLAFWVRPFAAVGAGFVGDRVGHTRAIVSCFIIMLLGYLVVASGFIQPSTTWMLFVVVISTCTAVFGVRGLYFAIFKDAGVSQALTGTAVGVVSVVGYTPDIFMGPLMGYCTDTYPGATGHEYLFGVLAAFAALGLIATIVFTRLSRQRAL